MHSARQSALIETRSTQPETGPQSRTRIHFRQVFTPSLRIFAPSEHNIAPRFCRASKTENSTTRSSLKLFRIAD
jgi:hypothetical protein